MHTIARCTHCGELLGTRAALSIHQPGKCRTDQTMRKSGAWRGYAGIWWTRDLGWDDETESPAKAAPQVTENKGRKLGKTPDLIASPYPASFTKFRKIRSARTAFDRRIGEQSAEASHPANVYRRASPD